MERHTILKEEFDKALFYSEKYNKLDKEHYLIVCKVHAEVFKHKYFEPCTCNPRTIKNWLMDLKKHFYS